MATSKRRCRRFQNAQCLGGIVPGRRQVVFAGLGHLSMETKTDPPLKAHLNINGSPIHHPFSFISKGQFCRLIDGCYGSRNHIPTKDRVWPHTSSFACPIRSSKTHAMSAAAPKRWDLDITLSQQKSRIAEKVMILIVVERRWKLPSVFPMVYLFCTLNGSTTRE